jgi:hypothetical protein
MKYKILFFFLLTMAMQVTAQHVNADRRAQVALNGNWFLTTISFPDSESNQITSFGLVDSKCFEGSIWKFDSDANSGEMMMAKNDCSSWGSPLLWELNKENQLLLKIENAHSINQSSNTDCTLQLANQTRESFQLIEKVEHEGKIITVVYAFRIAE